MLPKNKRLTTSLHKKVFERGKSVFGGVISLIYTDVYTEQDKSLSTRFGFSVSNKVGKTAPKRNTIRRKGYAVLEKIIQTIAPGYIAVFVVKRDISKEPFSFYLSTIQELIKKSPLFKK